MILQNSPKATIDCVVRLPTASDDIFGWRRLESHAALARDRNLQCLCRTEIRAACHSAPEDRPQCCASFLAARVGESREGGVCTPPLRQRTWLQDSRDFHRLARRLAEIRCQ